METATGRKTGAEEIDAERAYLARAREALDRMRRDVLDTETPEFVSGTDEIWFNTMYRMARAQRGQDLIDLPDVPLSFGRLDYAPGTLSGGATGEDRVYVGRRHVRDDDGTRTAPAVGGSRPTIKEFADLSATLTGLYARLDAAYAAQRRFVADASHELRTPLTVQRALIQVALADPDADATSLRAACEELLRIGDQQERLVAALLALAQGEQHPVATEPVDLAALASEAVTAHGSAAADHDLTVRTDIRRAVVARADPTLLASLIGNLLGNAIRHNIDGGRVDIATRRGGPHAVLTISNTGPVVPADAVDRILQPFQRLAAPRMQSGSTGLGLAIVRAIAGSHHADLRVRPNPDGGLTVTVVFAAA